MTQDKSLDAFLDAAYDKLDWTMNFHGETWGLGRHQTWNVDMEAGELAWITHDDVLVVAPMQVVGTYNPADSSFLWGWDHPSVPDGLREHAQLCHDWGAEVGNEFYTHRKIDCEVDACWEFVAVALKLADATGAFCGDMGDGQPKVFMTFGEVRMQKP